MRVLRMRFLQVVALLTESVAPEDSERLPKSKGGQVELLKR
jgi:hypothetical protein